MESCRTLHLALHRGLHVITRCSTHDLLNDWINKFLSFVLHSFIFWSSVLKGSAHIQNKPQCSLYGPLLSPRIALSVCVWGGWNERLRVRSAFDLFLTLSWLLCDFKHVTWTSPWPQLCNGAASYHRGIVKSSKSQSLSKQNHLQGSDARIEWWGKFNFPSQVVSWTNTLKVCGSN